MRRRWKALRERVWRDWCFVRVVLRHFRFRLALLALILVGGGSAFMWLEPEKGHSLPRAVYYAWSLIFGEPPEAFPQSPFLQGLFFLIPVLGLTVIIEGVIDLAMVIRDRQRAERGWCKMMAASLHDHVILVGLGKLGYKVYSQLRALRQTVVVVESDPKCQFLEVVRRDGVPLFIGDARREAILDDANVRKARSIILATDDDLANLETALDARRVAPDIRVVLRMFDQNMADKIKEGFNLHIAMSQSAISAPAFATAAIDGSIVNSFLVDGKVIVMQRWNVRPGGPLDGKRVGDVLSEMGFSVVERRDPDGNKRVFPPADVVLREGDRLLVQGPFDALSALTRKAGSVVEAGETARAG